MRMRSLNADLGIMAFVLQFAPQDFVNIPKQGTIQYHPSLLPKYRGPSSINWPIIRGDTKTGLTIFRPNDGLDEGPVVLQKETPIGPDDTLGSVYFDRLFPMGVQAMVEAADLVMAGKHKEVVQDESQATYEGWCRAAEAKLNWANHVDFVHNTIRGCNPAPGAWTTLERQERPDLRLQEASRAHVRRGEGQDRRGHRRRRQELPRHRAGRADRGAARARRGRKEGFRRRFRSRCGPVGRHAARQLAFPAGPPRARCRARRGMRAHSAPRSCASLKPSAGLLSPPPAVRA